MKKNKILLIYLLLFLVALKTKAQNLETPPAAFEGNVFAETSGNDRRYYCEYLVTFTADSVFISLIKGGIKIKQYTDTGIEINLEIDTPPGVLIAFKKRKKRGSDGFIKYEILSRKNGEIYALRLKEAARSYYFFGAPSKKNS